MAKAAAKLTLQGVKSKTKPGRYADGGHLYLSISKNGGKRWTFLYRRKVKNPGPGAPAYKSTEIGLGPADGGHMVSLKAARERAAELRKDLVEGRDPLTEKRKREEAAVPVPTFGAMADQFLKDKQSEWRNAEHKRQWEVSLNQHAALLRPIPVNQISMADVLKTLRPIWQKMPVTADRLRNRIELVMEAARAASHFQGNNPARWQGNLESFLPKRKATDVKPHPAMAYEAVPAFMARLRQRQTIVARAMEFCILTATRASETLKAEWSEFDMAKAVWTIPAVRMKTAEAHRVPLSLRAVAILVEMSQIRRGELVFSANDFRKPLWTSSLGRLLDKMEVGDATLHGFRSSFRTWAAETTSIPREICEAALAHKVTNRVEAAYQRSDVIQKRAQLMTMWADYCEPTSDNKIIPLSQGAKR